MDSNDKWLRIEDKLDRVMDRISSIDVTVAKQQISLEEHIKRSNMLEERMDLLKKESQPISHIKLAGLITVAVSLVQGLITSPGTAEVLKALLEFLGKP